MSDGLLVPCVICHAPTDPGCDCGECGGEPICDACAERFAPRRDRGGPELCLPHGPQARRELGQRDGLAGGAPLETLAGLLVRSPVVVATLGGGLAAR